MIILTNIILLMVKIKPEREAANHTPSSRSKSLIIIIISGGEAANEAGERERGRKKEVFM